MPRDWYWPAVQKSLFLFLQTVIALLLMSERLRHGIWASYRDYFVSDSDSWWCLNSTLGNNVVVSLAGSSKCSCKCDKKKILFLKNHSVKQRKEGLCYLPCNHWLIIWCISCIHFPVNVIHFWVSMNSIQAMGAWDFVIAMMLHCLLLVFLLQRSLCWHWQKSLA